MKVKVCGITRLEQLQALESAGADFAGLIFYPLSKRFAGEKLRDMRQQIKETSIKKVGVFVNEELGSVLGYIQEYGLYAVQLHGDEEPAYCKRLMEEAQVIKVFRLRSDSNIQAMVAPFLTSCHRFLFDTDTEGYGGSGRKFDWDLLRTGAITKAFYLSGGIGPDDVARLREFSHPCLETVDINSSFEIEPGIKDLEQVSHFIEKVKSRQSS